MNRLVIIGASGHGKVIADIARLNGYIDIVFLDDDESTTQCGGYPVVGKSSDAMLMDANTTDFIVGIGNASVRKRIQETLRGMNIATLIHPNAVVADDVEIGVGTVVMANAAINPGAKVGRGCIINTASSVDHDCRIGDFVHISVGSHLCGTDVIEDGTWISAGVTVSNNVYICRDCIIGAGAVVIKNIEETGTYVGVPVRKLEKMVKKDNKPSLGGGYSSFN